MDAPDVRWNPYLGKYLVVRAAQQNDGVYLSQTTMQASICGHIGSFRSAA
jgi:hypothetical protein